MTKEKTTSYRLGTMTLNQIDTLSTVTGMSKANVVQTAIDRMYQQERQIMTSKLAYEVSYTTEYSNGETQSNEQHTRYFPTREYAVSHARHITNEATDNNGIFDSGWIDTPFASMIDDDDTPNKMRIVALVQTVTIEEIANAIDDE